MTRRHLSTRERLRLFNLHGGICTFCGVKIDGTRDRWEISHDVPYELTRDESDGNMKPAHYACHREQTAKVDIPQIAKAKRVHAKHIGAKAPPKRRMPYRRFNGEIVWGGKQ